MLEHGLMRSLVLYSAIEPESGLFDNMIRCKACQQYIVQFACRVGLQVVEVVEFKARRLHTQELSTTLNKLENCRKLICLQFTA